MRKAINILVSIVFLISFIGVNIHKHYSQGKLYSTAIFHEAESCCADMEHCEMANMSETFEHHQKNNCSCEDKTETLKISDVFVSEGFSLPSEKTIDLNFNYGYLRLMYFIMILAQNVTETTFTRAGSMVWFLFVVVAIQPFGHSNILIDGVYSGINFGWDILRMEDGPIFIIVSLTSGTV